MVVIWMVNSFFIYYFVFFHGELTKIQCRNSVCRKLKPSTIEYMNTLNALNRPLAYPELRWLSALSDKSDCICAFRNSQSSKDENEAGYFTDDDLNRLNEIIGYKEDDAHLLPSHGQADLLHTYLEVHMKHNASKLMEAQECVAELSCEDLDCFIKLYSEAKVFDVKLGSYMLSSPNGLLAEVLFCFFWLYLPQYRLA